MMGLGMLTKITRNAHYASSRSVFPSSPPLKNAFRQRSISEYTMMSPSHLQKVCSPNGVVSRPMMIQKGFFGTRHFSNALWKGRSCIPAIIRNSRSYYSNSLHTGWRSFFPRSPVVIGLIAANVAVFSLWRVLDNEFMVKNFMNSLENYGSGRIHTLITSGFTHHNTFDFVTNMIALYLFGLSIGKSMGQKCVLLMYLSGAVTGSIMNLLFYSKLNVQAGVSFSTAQSASGAIFPLVAVGVSQLLGNRPSLPTFISMGIFGGCMLAKEYLTTFSNCKDVYDQVMNDSTTLQNPSKVVNSGFAMLGGGVIFTCYVICTHLIR